MGRTCDDCGAEVRDLIGSRQCSLFDVVDDSRVDPQAANDLRSGRVLCPACARGVPMLPGEAEADVVELAQAVVDLDDGRPRYGVPLSADEAWTVREILKPWSLTSLDVHGPSRSVLHVGIAETIRDPTSAAYRDRLCDAREAVRHAFEAFGVKGGLLRS